MTIDRSVRRLADAARARRRFASALAPDGGASATTLRRPDGAPRRSAHGKPLSYSGARDLALRLIRLKAESDRAILFASKTDTIMGIAAGLRAAFEGRGFAVDTASAQGIADAIQELVPGARDLVATLS